MPATGLLAAVALLAVVPSQAAAPPGAGEPARFERLQYRDRVESDGQQTRTMEVRVRLGTAQGVAQFGQIALPYVEGFGDVQFQDVAIEKANGHRVEVKGVLEDINPFGLTATSTPADVRLKKLTIPGLEPGDTLSYRIVHRQAPLAPGHAFGEFKVPPVPGGAPQTYELDVPRAGQIRVRLRDGLGVSWEEVPAAADRLVRRFVVRVEPPPDKAPATKAERQKWVEPDVIFTSFRSWTEVTSWWWGMSKDRLAPDAAVAKEAADLAAGARSAREKVGALFTFLATRIRYVNVSFGIGRMRPRAAAEVLRDRYGDCKDKHALLAALASSLGIEVRPVLINSTRDGVHDDVPGPQQFDHMISVVRLGASPSDWLWLDGTNVFGPAGYLLPHLRDKPALLVEADGTAALVRTPKDAPFLTRQEMTFKGALDAEGVLRGRAALVVRSDGEPVLRALFASVPQERWPSVIKDTFARAFGEVTVQNVVVSDPLDAAAPLRVEFDVEKRLAAAGGERGMAPPLPDFELPKASDPLPAGEPAVTFDVRETVARAEIEVPEEQKTRAPLSVSVERPFATFRSVYSREGRTLKLERTLSFPRPSLEAADLAAYDSFRDAVAKDSKQEFTIEGAAAAAGAEGLQREGLAAFAKKDYAKAAELLRQASEADAKRKDVFEDLGRALHELGRHQDAVAAFTRQVEATPFDETAYAWRAHSLQRMNRWDEAEKDLLKQIEVAPFHAWSYERMGQRRLSQGRLGEAVDFFARAAAIEPRKAERWLDLGGAQVAAAQPADARMSLERAMALDPAAWMKVQAAATYRALGDVARAGELAEAALPPLRERLGGITPDDLDEGDLYWMDRLVEAWGLIGEAAAAAGDLPRAERYLEPAWRVAFTAEAAWLLGEVREKQGRLADAVQLWRMAASVRAPLKLPADRQSRVDAASRKLRGKTTAAAGAPAQPDPGLMGLRTVRLAGPALASLTEEVLVLANAEGEVQSVSNLSRRDAKAFDRQIAKLGPIRLAWPRPDTEPFKVVRRALLACAAGSACALILDLPGMRSVPSGNVGSVSIAGLDPREGTVLRRQQHVSLVVTVRYRLEADAAVAGLVVQDQAGRPVIDSPVSEALAARSGEATLKGSFTVPADATRIDVFVPLTSGEEGATTTVATASFPVKSP